MKTITVRAPDNIYKKINKQVKAGIYKSQSDLVG